MILTTIRCRMFEVIKEIFYMLFKRKVFLIIFIFISLFGGLIFLVQGTAFSPLIYMVF